MYRNAATEMYPDWNVQTEMFRDRNGPDRNGLTETPGPNRPDRIGQTEKSRTPVFHHIFFSSLFGFGPYLSMLL